MLRASTMLRLCVTAATLPIRAETRMKARYSAAP
jgi:hypothetical protein